MYYKSQVYAPATRRAYKTHRNSYIAFCNRLGYTPVPASQDTLCRYAAFLAKSLKYNSVKQYINIIRLLHLEWGLPNPLDNNFSLTCTLKGIRRTLGDTINQKMPITPTHLKLILSKLSLSVALDANVWAVCLVLFFSLLRRSNVLPTTTSSFDPQKQLRRKDIMFYHWGISVSVRNTKTIQYGERMLNIPLPRSSNNNLCPVKAVFHAMSFSPKVPPEGPAFALPYHAGHISLTASVFIQKVTRCLQESGVDTSCFGGHSFRRGGASWGYANGLSTETIRILGDWKSSCYMNYVMPNYTSLRSAIKIMMENV